MDRRADILVTIYCPALKEYSKAFSKYRYIKNTNFEVLFLCLSFSGNTIFIYSLAAACWSLPIFIIF